MVKILYGLSELHGNFPWDAAHSRENFRVNCGAVRDFSSRAACPPETMSAMCCFTGNVQNVNRTRIFARLGTDGMQGLIYQMSLETKDEVAMVLPLPVKQGSGENALKFVNLEAYPKIFNDLSAGFPQAKEVIVEGYSLARQPKLAVVSVGAYEASYVPTIADFTRLDERFRLPGKVWEKLPEYRDYGFAIFKLKAGKTEVHPMAFRFPTRMPRSVFFPTMHIHKGKVQDQDDFDHTLYAQAPEFVAFGGWEESQKLAGAFVKTNLTEGLVLADDHMHMGQFHGRMANTDIIMG